MERHYRWPAYNKAFAEAEKYQYVDGVKEYLVQVEKKADDYEVRMTSFLERERPVENEQYNTYEMIVEKYNMCVWAGVIVILIKFLLFCAMMAGQLAGLYILGHIAACIYIVLFIVLRVKAIKAEKQYRAYSSNVLQQIAEINNSFQKIIDAMKNDVDQMYLDSLEPMALQLELMRRENARNSQQLIELQNKMVKGQERLIQGQEEMIREQRNMVAEQRNMVKEQQKTRQVNERMSEDQKYSIGIQEQIRDSLTKKG